MVSKNLLGCQCITVLELMSILLSLLHLFLHFDGLGFVPQYDCSLLLAAAKESQISNSDVPGLGDFDSDLLKYHSILFTFQGHQTPG